MKPHLPGDFSCAAFTKPALCRWLLKIVDTLPKDDDSHVASFDVAVQPHLCTTRGPLAEYFSSRTYE